jgi:hypothetical protein
VGRPARTARDGMAVGLSAANTRNAPHRAEKLGRE